VIGYANSRQSPIDAGMVLRGIFLFLFVVSDRVVGVCECNFFFLSERDNIKFTETIKRIPPGPGQDQDRKAHMGVEAIIISFPNAPQRMK
jgi:hypothetical protein